MIVYPVTSTVIRDAIVDAMRQAKLYIPPHMYTKVYFEKNFHVTLCPPFYTSHELATRLNLGLAVQDLSCNSNDFYLGNLAFFENQSTDTLHFEVKCPERILKHVHRIRNGLKGDTDICFAGNSNSEGVKLHITVAEGKDLAKLPELAHWVNQYNTERNTAEADHRPRRFGQLVSCLFIKHQGGWKHLTSEPERV